MSRDEALSWLTLAVRLATAGIWLVAGVAKIADLPAFESQVRQYGILPGSLVAPFAYALPFVEVALGLYLLAGLLVRPGALLGCGLFAVFLVAQVHAWVAGRHLDCGCFGQLSHERVGAETVVRDAVLALPSLVLAFRPRSRLGLDGRIFAPPHPVRRDQTKASASVAAPAPKTTARTTR